MTRFLPALHYVLIALVLLILLALAVWYFVLRARTETIETVDARRGADIPAQSFSGVVGSTYENVVSTLTTIAGGNKEEKLPRLVQISKTPTAGAGFVSAQATTSRLRFVERSTGYVLEAALEGGALSRLTNTLVPRVYNAIVTKKDRIIMQSVDEANTVVTVAATLATTSPAGSTGPLTQKRLADNILSLVASPSGDEIFYVAPSANGAIGIRAAWDGTKQKQVFSSAISGWRTYWIAPERILLAQHASDSSSGYAYELRKDGGVSPVIRDTSGLTLLPHQSSSALLYGESGSGVALYARAENSSIVSLPVRTVADKCVWAPASPKATQGKPEKLVAYCAVPQIAPGGGFLDRWYRGEIHTADAWWKVDVSANAAELLYAPGNDVLDVEDPIIDDTGNYIAFINAIDKSLWLLRIEQ